MLQALTSFAALLDLAAQRGNELAVVPRLLHEVAHATAHGLDGEIHRAPSGHDNHRQRAVERLDAGQQIDALTPRRGVARIVQIHQEQIERLGTERGKGRVRGGYGLHIDALRFEQELEGIDEVRLIVGDQDARLNRTGGIHVRLP